MTDTTSSSQPIKIAQLNVQRKKQVTLQLLNSFSEDFDIFLIQEPAWGFIGRDPSSGKDINGPVALRGWTTILPVTSIPRLFSQTQNTNLFQTTPGCSCSCFKAVIY